MYHEMPCCVAEAFLKMANAQPDAPALIFDDMTYSFEMLRDLVASFAIRMRETGIDENATVQIRSNDLAASLAGTLAASRIGARVVERAINFDFKTGHRFTHVLSEVEDEGTWRNLLIDNTFSPNQHDRNAKDNIWDGLYPASDTAWLILTTSGTTGTPKALALSQELVMRRTIALTNDLGERGSRTALLFPVGSRPFFAHSLATICLGGALVGTDDWDFWQQSGVTRVSGSLTQVRNLVSRTTSESKLPEVEVIGEKTTSVDIDDCLKIFDCVDDTFGASEINKANSTIYAIRGGQRICHARLWAQKIEIVDGDNNLCANGSEGRLRILSDTAIDSYIGTAVEAPATIDGWFYTGDVACLSDEGILDIRFRENPDILTVAGSKIDFKLIEATISSIEGIKRAAVFLSPKTDATNLIAFAVYDKGENRIQLAAHANEAIREKLGAAFMPTRIWPIDAIPVTPFGKVDRNACKGIIRDAIAATAQNLHHLPQ